MKTIQIMILGFFIFPVLAQPGFNNLPGTPEELSEQREEEKQICPYCDQNLMGRGMMTPRNEPLAQSDVKELVESYMNLDKNPNLKIGNIKEMEYVYEVEILTQDGTLADKLVVDKKAGWVRSAY